jgi:hypothetical protein
MTTNAPAAVVVTALLALPAAPDAIRNRVMPTAPNRLYIPSVSLVWLTCTAYGDGGFNTAMRVSGGPDWANRTAFAVEVVVIESAQLPAAN